MPKQFKRRTPPSVPRRILNGILLLALAAGLSYGAALLWQRVEDDAASESASAPSSQEDWASSIPSSSGVMPLPESSAPPSSEPAPESSEPSTSSESSSEPAAPAENVPEALFPVREEFPDAVPISSEMADKNYFDDALFFGDSISVGIPSYHVMDNAAVIAFQGINTLSINTREVIDLTGDGTRVTMLEAAKQQYPDKQKIYIMLGGNGLDYGITDFMNGYRNFVQSVQEAYPGARIFLQSITPVTENAHQIYPSVSNEKITAYNLEIMAMAKDLRVHFVDVAAAMIDENGNLPLEASPSDGMHLGPEYYHKWFDYLRWHTAD